ncbi:hypothetical protein BDQ17DRAFT_1026286 [Cyathus striatus]|nr:hypothetical protein BDQ17DRAFT_1026286 [Cyathus striatus]
MEHNHGTFLMSRDMQGHTGSQMMPPLGVLSDYNFKCAGHEGAILILPEGSYREDLRAIGRNGVCWYRYANRVRGVEEIS